MKRVISLWLPRLATDRIERTRAKNAPSRPLATVVSDSSGLMIAAVNARAEREGIHPGQTLSHARALVPALEAAPHDEAADKRLLMRLADWCARYSPFVAADGDNGLFLDITGCAHLFGGEAAMLDDLCRNVARFGLARRAAIAATPAAAFALSRYKPAQNATSAIVPQQDTAAALAPLPVAALRLDDETAAGLARLGLRLIGDLYGLPRAPLAARFGRELWDRLDAALGHADEPVSPRPPAEPHRVRIAFAEPIIETEQIARGLRRLLHTLCERLQREQAGARRLALAVTRVDGSEAKTEIGTARAARDPERLALLFAERLPCLDPGFGVEAMALTAPVVESCPPEQVSLPAQPSPSPPSPPSPSRRCATGPSLSRRAGESEDACRLSGEREAASFSSLSRRAGKDEDAGRSANESEAAPFFSLSRRAGEGRGEGGTDTAASMKAEGEGRGVSKGRLSAEALAKAEGEGMDTAALIERLGNRTGASRVHYLAARESHVPERAQRAVSAFDSLPQAFAAGVPRPPRLLSPPQPIEAVAPIPDDPPLLFRWRRIVHRVRRAEGPERILSEWWRGESGFRDYYRVEDTEGRRFWLFRDGPHGPATRWFLHGLFP